MNYYVVEADFSRRKTIHKEYYQIMYEAAIKSYQDSIRLKYSQEAIEHLHEVVLEADLWANGGRSTNENLKVKQEPYWSNEDLIILRTGINPTNK